MYSTQLDLFGSTDAPQGTQVDLVAMEVNRVAHQYTTACEDCETYANLYEEAAAAGDWMSAAAFRAAYCYALADAMDAADYLSQFIS